MTSPLLELSGFGVAFGDRIVLAEVDAVLLERGLTVLMGPAGSGKSTLLRTLAGLNDANPSLATWGRVCFEGRELPVPAVPAGKVGEPRRGMAMVTQHARFFLETVRGNLTAAFPDRHLLDRGAQTARAVELLRAHGLATLAERLDQDGASLPTAAQRLLAVVCAIAAEPRLMLADEPTAGLDTDGARGVTELLREQARHRSVLVVTHDQRVARAAGGTTIMLAAGRVQEVAPTVTFLDAPETEVGRAFIRTGGCALPSPDASPEHLASETPPPPPLPLAAHRGAASPRGFFWVLPQRLGGLPRPGIVAELEDDLAGLVRLGVHRLVTLEETCTVSSERLREIGVSSSHFPVPDMGAPGLSEARCFCVELSGWLGAGERVALHCRAGLGRTGTLLAAYLVFDGEAAESAIQRVRRINPRCIQSEEQVEFLAAFERALRQAPAPQDSISSNQQQQRTENECHSITH